MPGLLDLSTEVFERMLLCLEDTTDIARVALTCKAAHDIIYSPKDCHIWRTLFLRQFDDPRPARACHSHIKQDRISDIDVSWRKVLTTRIQSFRVLLRHESPEAQKSVLADFLSLLMEAPPGSTSDSRNVRYVQRILSKAGSEKLFGAKLRPYLIASNKELSPIDACEESAKLSTVVGLGGIIRLEAGQKERAGARALCYNLKNWTSSNKFGPFKTDGSVDWQHMEAIMLVACANGLDLIKALGVNNRIRCPCALSDARPYSAPDWERGETGDEWDSIDWAGVRGCWRRCISFLDWNDLQRYQNAITNGVSPAYFERFAGPSGFTGEAVRMLTANLRIVDFRPGPIADRPTLYFEGDQPATPQYPTVFGRVEARANGDIIWRIVSRYGGRDRWSSIGAQVGGVRSAFGVLGIWSGIEHAFDAGDPAGPWHMWKVFDDEPDPHQVAEGTLVNPPLDAGTRDRVIPSDVQTPANDA